MSKSMECFIHFGLAFWSVALGIVIGVLIVLFNPGMACADARLDNMRSMDTEDYCTVVADQFLAGVLNQAYGSAREFKATTPAIVEMVEHGLPLPKDAMYVLEWDDHTPAEKEFLRQHVLEGYDEAAKIGREVTEEEAVEMARAYFSKCMREPRASLSSPFLHVEALENVAPAKRLSQCTEWLSDYKFVALAVKHGRDCDQMKEWNQTVEGVADERRAKITRLVSEACAAGKEGVDAWFEEYSRQCMGL